MFQKLKEICVRSKKYWDVNKNDCGFVSIWLLQFHGDKTWKILDNIKSTDPNRFNSIMTDSLFKDINKASKSKRNDTQANQYKKLMEDPKAQKEMDKAEKEWGKSLSLLFFSFLENTNKINYGQEKGIWGRWL